MVGVHLSVNLILACITGTVNRALDGNFSSAFLIKFSVTQSIECYLCIPPTDDANDYCAKENLQNRVDNDQALILSCNENVTHCRYCVTINENQLKGMCSSTIMYYLISLKYSSLSGQQKS